MTSIEILLEIVTSQTYERRKLYRPLCIAGFQCHAIQKIDENRNQNHSIDQVQSLRKERR